MRANLFVLFEACESGENMRKSGKRSKRKKSKLKGSIIKRQYDEIASLKSEIEKLNIDSNEKDKIISSVDRFIKEFESLIDDLKKKSLEYDKLMDELISMRNAINEEVFKKRWWLIKWLLR